MEDKEIGGCKGCPLRCRCEEVEDTEEIGGRREWIGRSGWEKKCEGEAKEEPQLAYPGCDE